DLVVEAEERALVGAGVDDADVGLAGLDGDAVDQRRRPILEGEVLAIEALQEVDLLQDGGAAGRSLAGPDGNVLEGGEPGGGRDTRGRAGPKLRAQHVVLVKGEEEQLVLDDRSTDVHAELMAMEVGGLREAGALFDVRQRVEPAGRVVLPGLPADAVGARLRDEVDLSAAVAAEL